MMMSLIAAYSQDTWKRIGNGRFNYAPILELVRKWEDFERMELSVWYHTICDKQLGRG